MAANDANTKNFKDHRKKNKEDCLPFAAESGGVKGLKPPLRMMSRRNYSGAENHDKDRYALIECSNTLIEQSRPS